MRSPIHLTPPTLSENSNRPGPRTAIISVMLRSPRLLVKPKLVKAWINEMHDTARDQWCPGWESNPHEEKSPEDFKSSASAIPPPGQGRYRKVACPARAFKENARREARATPWEPQMQRKQRIPRRFAPSE